MKILIDENIPRMRSLGHDVMDIRACAALALAESRVLITTDKGFTD